MSVYADSSFIVSIYVTDVHSSEARRRVHGSLPLILTPFHRADWAHALAQHQFRGTLTADAAWRIDAQFKHDESVRIFRANTVPETAFDLCADLARKHGPILAMRTLDSFHVACALELRAERFWTFDERQSKLAKAEGLKTA